MLKTLALVLSTICVSFALNVPQATARPSAPSPSYYRELTKRVRSDVSFNVSLPMPGAHPLNYHLELGSPIYKLPIVSDVPVSGRPGLGIRSFWDRIFATADSYLEIGGTKHPISCIFISGQDNRGSGVSGPQYPDVIMRVYIVADNPSCEGPIAPGWPSTGGSKEAWHTYLYYEIHDIKTMRPMIALLRYQWAKFPVKLVE